MNKLTAVLDLDRMVTIGAQIGTGKDLPAYIDDMATRGVLSYTTFVADGHTEKQLIPLVKLEHQTLAYVADLIPSVAHLPLAYVASYDVRPLVAMTEKERFLKEALAKDWTLFFEHDPVHETCRLMQTEKGIRARASGFLTSI